MVALNSLAVSCRDPPHSLSEILDTTHLSATISNLNTAQLWYGTALLSAARTGLFLMQIILSEPKHIASKHTSLSSQAKNYLPAHLITED